MTFEQFCQHHNVSRDEQAALSSYLLALRLNKAEVGREPLLVVAAGESTSPSRDQLAALAMQGLLAAGFGCVRHNHEQVSAVAYRIADAMLTERKGDLP